MAYEPFIDDPEHLRELEGQRFVVLRPARVVRECYCNAQALVRQRVSALPASFPVRAHVTLAGFAAGSPLGAVQELVAEWIRDVPPLWIEVQRATSFPAPFQIAILEVQKTSALLKALQRLRRAAEKRGLIISTSTPPEQWVFHMSVAYCSKLTPEEWRSRRSDHAPSLLLRHAPAGSVQLSTFGRLLQGHRDELPGFEPSLVRIEDPKVAAAAGRTHHANVTFNGRKDGRVSGTVFEVTDAELAAADRHERMAGYTRIVARLASGMEAWLYVDARSVPAGGEFDDA